MHVTVRSIIANDIRHCLEDRTWSPGSIPSRLSLTIGSSEDSGDLEAPTGLGWLQNISHSTRTLSADVSGKMTGSAMFKGKMSPRGTKGVLRGIVHQWLTVFFVFLTVSWKAICAEKDVSYFGVVGCFCLVFLLNKNKYFVKRCNKYTHIIILVRNTN